MQERLARYIPRGSVVLAVTTFASYGLGLLRDRIFFQKFGLSTSLDSYNAAFLVPDFLFNLLVASGIAAAAVPLFMEVRARSEKHADAYIAALLTSATTVMLVVSIGVAIFAPYLSRLVAPGLAEEGRALVTSLMRVLAFSSVLFAASNTLGAMLVAKKRFFWYGVSPILYNVGIIVGSLWLSPQFGITGVAYGTLAGAALHLLVRLWDAHQSGWRWREGNFPRQEMVRTLKLMAPKMVGHPVELVTFWVFTSFASLLGAGSISALNFARNFQSVPVSLLGIAMATAVFPSLSEVALSSGSELKKLFHRTALAILVVSAAAAAVMFLIRRPLVAILLGGSDVEAVGKVALVLGAFCLSIPTESLSHLFARAFYAVQNTIIPVIFSVVSLVVAGASAYLLMGKVGIIGLPLGFFLGSAVKTIGLYLMFVSRRNLN